MGVLGSVVNGVVEIFQGAGFILALVLAFASWPLVTDTTKLLLLAVIFSTVANDVFFPRREYSLLDALLGLGGGAVVMGMWS
jgi:hypothetical protein